MNLRKLYSTSLLLAIALFSSCCDDNICPKDDEFFIFTDEELHVLWDDIDTMLVYQNWLSSGNTKKADSMMTYMTDTALSYRMNSKEVLTFSKYSHLYYENRNWICSTQHSMQASTGIGGGLNESFDIFVQKQYKEVKYTLHINAEGSEINTQFYPNKDTVISVDYFYGWTSTESPPVNFTAKMETFQIDDQQYYNCIVFRYTSLQGEELFTAAYSNKYGFIYIRKYNKDVYKKVF